jgi:hypothetical protein
MLFAGSMISLTVRASKFAITVQVWTIGEGFGIGSDLSDMLRG